jgi:hypothetical protein
MYIEQLYIDMDRYAILGIKCVSIFICVQYFGNIHKRLMTLDDFNSGTWMKANSIRTAVHVYPSGSFKSWNMYMSYFLKNGQISKFLKNSKNSVDAIILTNKLCIKKKSKRQP